MSEGKTFLYFLTITGFDWLQFSAFRLSQRPQPLSTSDYFDVVFAFAITLGGLVYLFLCNGHLRGVHFLYRYFPLSVVVAGSSSRRRLSSSQRSRRRCRARRRA